MNIFILHPAIKCPSSRPPSSSTALRDEPAGRISKMELALEIPETGGLSCSSRRYLVKADLKLLRLFFLRITCGMMFQSLAPITLKDSSYIFCVLGLQVLDIGGILQQGPRRFVSMNSSWRSLGVRFLNILKTCIMMYRSRRRCSDIRLSFFSLPQ